MGRSCGDSIYSYPQLRYRVGVTVLQSTDRMERYWYRVREVGFPVLAVAVIVLSADIRMPIGLPGHRGVVWLTMLVAVALATRTRETVIAVGAASTTVTLLLHPHPWDSARYLLAALLLYAVGATGLVRARPWLLALAAAPIHLVALAGPVGLLTATGFGMKVACHLGFGLAAGLLGTLTARLIDQRG